ncbi:MAG: SDR family oxidoreductase, partial [Lachnospiraceae bacterium]|nr:SDR family oxidoreductase [Lachnospiraceae bacterium]
HTSTTALNEVHRQIVDLGRQCISYIGDIGNSSQVNSFFQQISQNYSTIDVLINNAGISHVGLIQDMSDAEWERILQSNLSSVFYCCREAVPSMLSEKSGHIINISSVWGNIGASTEVAYSATKGGVNALTRALAKELAPSHIQVNAIACGYIDTEMNQHLSTEEKKQLCSEIPAGRAGMPEDVADMVLALLKSPDYLTGQIIPLDGGWI